VIHGKQQQEQAMTKVQIAISGQYAGNYAAADWNGEGQCPQGWKQKGQHTEIMVCDVPLEHATDVMHEVRMNMEGHSWSNDFSSCRFDTVQILPNKLSQSELVEWEYKAYQDITSVPLHEIYKFLAAVEEV
jgi:hypothetical protein